MGSPSNVYIDQPVPPTVVALKGSVFNTSVTASTNIFSADLAPTYPPADFEIYVCFDTTGVLSLVRTSGGVSKTEEIDSGGSLVANAGYTFRNIAVDPGETINLQYSVNATALKISVREQG